MSPSTPAMVAAATGQEDRGGAAPPEQTATVAARYSRGGHRGQREGFSGGAAGTAGNGRERVALKESGSGCDDGADPKARVAPTANGNDDRSRAEVVVRPALPAMVADVAGVEVTSVADVKGVAVASTAPRKPAL